MILAEKKYSPYKFQEKPESRHWAGTGLKKHIQVVGLILSFFTFGLFYTFKHTQVVNLGYQIDEIKQEIAALQRENKRLELEIARLQAPERIERIATTKLGMKEPREFLLAKLPSEQAPKGSDQVLTQHQEKTRKNPLLIAAHQFVRRAEASPR